MPTKGKDLVREFQKAGWKLDRVNGSHHILIKGNKTAVIPVHGSRELGIGLEKKLRKSILT